MKQKHYLLRKYQRVTEQSMLGIWFRDKTTNQWIHQQTEVVAIRERDSISEVAIEAIDMATNGRSKGCWTNSFKRITR